MFLFSLAVTQQGSKLGIGSVLCSLAYAVKLPLSSVLFTLPIFMGDFAEHQSVWCVFGLFLVTGGFLSYVFSAERAAKAAREAEVFSTLAQESVCEAEPTPWGFHERVVGCVATQVVRQ